MDVHAKFYQDGPKTGQNYLIFKGSGEEVLDCIMNCLFPYYPTTVFSFFSESSEDTTELVHLGEGKVKFTPVVGLDTVVRAGANM
jgi:hypothetical protein